MTPLVKMLRGGGGGGGGGGGDQGTLIPSMSCVRATYNIPQFQ